MSQFLNRISYFFKTNHMNSKKEQLLAFERLLNIMDDLREKCPWDKKQTMQSLRHLTIEETYELGDAILDNDLNHRHPHIYSDVVVKDEEEVKQNWEKLKLKEGKKSVLEGVPKSLPALVKASRIQDKVKGVGFDWEESHQVWDKVQEELQELQEEVIAGNQDEIEAEFGDVLFSMINYARFLNVNPEDALERTNKKFIKRFQYLENKAIEMGKPIMDMTLAEMDVFWNEAKQL